MEVHGRRTDCAHFSGGRHGFAAFLRRQARRQHAGRCRGVRQPPARVRVHAAPAPRTAQVRLPAGPTTQDAQLTAAGLQACAAAALIVVGAEAATEGPRRPAPRLLTPRLPRGGAAKSRRAAPTPCAPPPTMCLCFAPQGVTGRWVSGVTCVGWTAGAGMRAWRCTAQGKHGPLHRRVRRRSQESDRVVQSQSACLGKIWALFGGVGSSPRPVHLLPPFGAQISASRHRGGEIKVAACSANAALHGARHSAASWRNGSGPGFGWRLSTKFTPQQHWQDRAQQPETLEPRTTQACHRGNAAARPAAP